MCKNKTVNIKPQAACALHWQVFFFVFLLEQAHFELSMRILLILLLLAQYQTNLLNTKTETQGFKCNGLNFQLS